jgi:hypothetical protein
MFTCGKTTLEHLNDQLSDKEAGKTQQQPESK